MGRFAPLTKTLNRDLYFIVINVHYSQGIRFSFNPEQREEYVN